MDLDEMLEAMEEDYQIQLLAEEVTTEKWRETYPEYDPYDDGARQMWNE